MSEQESRAYVDDQYAAARQLLAQYNPDVVLVTGLDIGHTDPQQVLPYGGHARVDPSTHHITVTY
jgi:muramoyltetrapeptide carboxypeptidase LdcA involved in peptidoglycan recycling